MRNLREFVNSSKLPDWHSFLKQLKGDFKEHFKVYACPYAAALYNVRKEDLVEEVDEIRGAESFLEEVYGGVMMYL